ncbi:unnamed protein product, partial [marine sediment metagenome]
EFTGTFSVNKYTFEIKGLLEKTKYFYYIKNTSPGENARTGVYSHYQVEGGSPPVIPIDIGSEAINRTYNWGAQRTLINRTNPANETGKIVTIKIYGTNLNSVKIATFFNVSGNYFSTRDWQSLGNVGTGYKEITVDLEVAKNDYIGIYFSAGTLDIDLNGGDGDWAVSYQDLIPCTNKLFTLNSTTQIISLYGEGYKI